MPYTPNRNWLYPDKGIPAWYTTFVSMVNQQDADVQSLVDRTPYKFFSLTGSDKTVTQSAAISGSVTGSIDVGISYGIMMGLRVKANSETLSSTIEFFADEAMSDRIYLASSKDCYTSGHIDRTAWGIFSFTNTVLENSKLYYKITNNGSNASTYDIEVVGHGKI